jgi:hypothetical protein
MFDRASISGDSVTLVLQDGGSGDNDLSANGEIYDPSGLAFQSVAKEEPKAIPIHQIWMLLLACIGILLLVRHAHAIRGVNPS